MGQLFIQSVQFADIPVMAAYLAGKRGRAREATCYSTAYASRPVTLYRSPGGRTRIRLAARTPWKSPRVLGVLRHRRGWLAVQPLAGP